MAWRLGSGEGELQGVLFDVDGTLYDPAPVRRAMLLELARLPVRTLAPRRAWRTVRCIGSYRRVLEELRADPPSGAESLGERHERLAAQRAGVELAELRAIVGEWMGRRPLPHVARARRPGLVELVRHLAREGVRLGVFSDYPTSEKVAALGVGEEITLHLCASDPQVNALKPDPRGFLRACELWGLAPAQVLYVGDRAEVDAAGAAAAGMPCVLIGPTQPTADPSAPRRVANFTRLLEALRE